MPGRQFTLVLILALALTTSALSQPGVACFSYYPEGGNFALGSPCVNAQPYADGTPIWVMRDRNGNGPDSTDQVVSTGVFNGAEVGIGPGFFSMDPCTGLDSVQIYPSYYLRVVAGNCCWQTRTFQVNVGPQDINTVWRDWECHPAICQWTGSADEPTAHRPDGFGLTQVYPNPFNPETRIQFTVSTPIAVDLAVYNLSGQRVRTLLSGATAAGEHTVTWDGRSDANTPVGTGLYLCRMSTTRQVSTKRLLLLK